MQSLGDHKKKWKDNEGNYKIELGVVFYMHSSCNKIVYKRDVEWWLIDIDDVVKSLEKPVQEKVKGSQVLYYFKGLIDV